MAITVPIVSTWEPRGLEKAVRDIQKAEGGLAKAGAAAKALQGPALAAFGAISAGAAVSVKNASDLGETFNAVEKTFGKGAKTITDFGKTAAQTAGLSQREFQQLATTTGALFTNMGQSQQEAADNTVILTQRAADMASVFNTDVGTALEAINAGLRGESEPLRAFGVGLSDVAIKAKALELGLYSGTGALDANAKAAATQALILDQTAQTAGDFADTSDSMANAQRSLTAELENVSAEMGEALLPYMEDFVAVLRRAVDWVKNNQRTVKIFIVALASLSAAIIAVNVGMKLWRVATITFTAAQWLLNAALTANPIGLVIAAIVALVAALVLAYKKSTVFRNVVDSVFRFLKSVVVGYINIYVNAVKKIWEWFQKIIDLAGALKDKISGLFGGLKVPSFLRGALGVSVAPAPSAFSARTARTPAVARNVTINIMGTGDPIRTGATIKRMLETNDIAQGRPRGVPLALAW